MIFMNQSFMMCVKILHQNQTLKTTPKKKKNIKNDLKCKIFFIKNDFT